MRAWCGMMAYHQTQQPFSKGCDLELVVLGSKNFQLPLLWPRLTRMDTGMVKSIDGDRALGHLRILRDDCDQRGCGECRTVAL